MIIKIQFFYTHHLTHISLTNSRIDRD